VASKQADFVSLIWGEFAAETAGGFPRLKRCPQTKVIQFLDYYASLDEQEQSDLLDALAVRGESMLFPGRDRLAPFPPAFDRYWKAATTPSPFIGGYRYTDVKMLSMIPNVAEYGGYEGWIKTSGASGRALEPRADLLRSIDSLVPAKAPLLRKPADAAFQERGFKQRKRPAASKNTLARRGSGSVSISDRGWANSVMASRFAATGSNSCV
jgi:hypothetical protein